MANPCSISFIKKIEIGLTVRFEYDRYDRLAGWIIRIQYQTVARLARGSGLTAHNLKSVRCGCIPGQILIGVLPRMGHCLAGSVGIGNIVGGCADDGYKGIVFDRIGKIRYIS